MARLPDRRRIKRLRNYTVSEAATVTRMHRNTVRAWIKDGLPVVTTTRPFLILGADLIEFLKRKEALRRRKCGPGEIFCLKCRDAVAPAAGMADLEPQTSKIGRLVGLCPSCGTLIYRCVSMAHLSEAAGSLDVRVKAGSKRIRDTATPFLNSDLDAGPAE